MSTPKTTTDEAQSEIQRHLAQLIQDPIVSVSLAASSGAQQISGEHLVGPDGRVFGREDSHTGRFAFSQDHRLLEVLHDRQISRTMADQYSVNKAGNSRPVRRKYSISSMAGKMARK